MHTSKIKMMPLILALLGVYLLVPSVGFATQSAIFESNAKDNSSIESLVENADLISLRKALQKDKQIVKKALLASVDRNLDQPNVLIENISALDSNTGSYLQTARFFLLELRSDFRTTNLRDDNEIIKSIIKKASVLYLTPIAEHSVDYVFSNILAEPVFAAFVKDKKHDFFIEYRKTNPDDLSGALNLLAELDLGDNISTISSEIMKLMLQITTSSNAYRNIFESKFMDVSERISVNVEEVKIRSSVSSAHAAFLIDRMEEENEHEASLVFAKLKKNFPEYSGLKSFEKYFVDIKAKGSKLKSKKLKDTSQSFLKSSEKSSNTKSSSFPFGIVILSAFSALGYFLYRNIKNITAPKLNPAVASQNEKKESPKFEELADFDEQLGLVN